MVRLSLCLVLCASLASPARSQVAWLLGSDTNPTNSPFTAGSVYDAYLPSNANPLGGGNTDGHPLAGSPGHTVSTFEQQTLTPVSIPGAGGMAVDYTQDPPRIFCSDGFVMTIEDHPEYALMQQTFGCGIPANAGIALNLPSALSAAGSGLQTPITGLAFNANVFLTPGGVPKLYVMDCMGRIETFTVSSAGALTFHSCITGPYQISVDPNLDLPTGLGVRLDTVYVSSFGGVGGSKVYSFVEGAMNFNTTIVPGGVSALSLTINRSQDPTLLGSPGPYHVVVSDGNLVVDADTGDSFSTGYLGSDEPYGLAFCPDAQWTSAVCGPGGSRIIAGLDRAPYQTAFANPASILIPDNTQQTGGPIPGITVMAALVNTVTGPPVPFNLGQNLCTYLLSPTTTLVEFLAPSGPCITIPGTATPVQESVSFQFIWLDPFSNDYRGTDLITAAPVFF